MRIIQQQLLLLLLLFLFMIHTITILTTTTTTTTKHPFVLVVAAAADDADVAAVVTKPLLKLQYTLTNSQCQRGYFTITDHSHSSMNHTTFNDDAAPPSPIQQQQQQQQYIMNVSSSSSSYTDRSIENANDDVFSTLCDPTIGIRSISHTTQSYNTGSEHGTIIGRTTGSCCVVSQFTMNDIYNSLLFHNDNNNDDNDDDRTYEDTTTNTNTNTIFFELWMRVPSAVAILSTPTMMTTTEPIPILTIRPMVDHTVHNNDDESSVSDCDKKQINLQLTYQATTTGTTATRQQHQWTLTYQTEMTLTTTNNNSSSSSTGSRSSNKECHSITAVTTTTTINSNNDNHTSSSSSSFIHVVVSIQSQPSLIVVVYINGRPIITTTTTTAVLPNKSMLPYNNNDWQWWHFDSKIYLFGSIDSYLTNNDHLYGSNQNTTTNHDITETTETSRSSSSIATDASISLSITLYQFSIYVTPILQQHIEEEYVQNLIFDNTLPSIPPFVYNQSIVVYEDAEAVPGSHYINNDIAWYRTSSSSFSNDDSTSRLNGPHVIYLDRDVQELIYATAVTSPIMIQFPSLRPIYMYITELPHLGQLYFFDDGIVNSNPTLLSFPNTNNIESLGSVFIPIGRYDPNLSNLKYVPPHNVISYPNTYTSFRYCISIGSSMMFDIHQCHNAMATVNIVIVPVNDPPIAFSTPTVVVREFTMNHTVTTTATNCTNDNIDVYTFQYNDRNSCVPKIHLHGSDVDLEDTIVGIQIVKAPQLGYLSMVVSSFRQDSIMHGTRLPGYADDNDNSNIIRSDIDPVYVQYTFDRNMVNTTIRNVIVQNNDVKDYFTYRVRDRQGLWSMEERVEIQIVSSLVAYADDPMVRLTEDDSIQLLHWYGIDLSVMNRQRHLKFYIEKIPSREVGILIHPQTNVTITQPGMIELEPSVERNELHMRFQSAQNFCHPLTTNNTMSSYDNEVRFRIVSYTNANTGTNVTTTAKAQIDSISDPFTQRILIECKLDNIVFTVPENIAAGRSIAVSSLQRTTTDPCYAIQWINPSNIGMLNDVTPTCQSAAIINGITLSSIDHRASMVTVSVTTKIGLITLNPHYWNRSDPILGRPVLSAGTIVFRAYPDDVTSILSKLHYQSFVIGNDTIDFIVQYGNCTTDDTQQQQNTTTDASTNVSFRTSTCQILDQSIPIEVISDASYDQYKEQWRAKFPWQILLCLIGYPALYIVFVLLELWYCREMSHHATTGSTNNNNNNTNNSRMMIGNNDDNDSTILLDTMTQSPHDDDNVQPKIRVVDNNNNNYIQHEDDDGMIYYEDIRTGMTHWSIMIQPPPPVATNR